MSTVHSEELACVFVFTCTIEILFRWATKTMTAPQPEALAGEPYTGSVWILSSCTKERLHVLKRQGELP
jgi:hypothetical protein